MRKFLLTLPLLLVACGKEEDTSDVVVGEVSLPTHTYTHIYTQAPPLKVELLTNRTTEDFIRAVIDVDQECLEAQGLSGKFDLYGQTIVILDTYEAGREVCPGGDGCYKPEVSTIFVPFGNTYGEQWDAELLAHELNHLFLGQTAKDYDASHTNSQVFGRRDGAYGWNETNHKTVSECVAKAFGG